MVGRENELNCLFELFAREADSVNVFSCPQTPAAARPAWSKALFKAFAEPLDPSRRWSSSGTASSSSARASLTFQCGKPLAAWRERPAAVLSLHRPGLYDPAIE